ncbi:hypothetical protein JGI25_01638, partial [Candidatus Kryptobacter tengchongensis]
VLSLISSVMKPEILNFPFARFTKFFIAVVLPVPGGDVIRKFFFTYIGVLFSIALTIVAVSAYSRAVPIGKPLAIRVTFTPKGLMRFAM